MILKSSLIILFTNLASHLLNYLYHFIAGRFLTIDQFSLLQSFISLNYLLAVLISSFSLSIIHQLHRTPKNKQPQLITALQSLSLKLSLITWLATLIFFPFIKRLLHFQNPYLLFIFSLQILFSFLPTLYLSLLQAKLKFKQIGLINFFSPLTKTASALILFLLGFKLFGALIAMALAGLVPATFSYQLVQKHLKGSELSTVCNKVKDSSKPTTLSKSFYIFGLAAFITNLSLTSLYNSDILLVRFFISHQSGLYAAASVLAKIIFFASNAVLTVTFPIFTLQTKNPIKLKASFNQALFLISIIAFTGVIFYHTFPHLIIKLFSSPAYTPATAILPGFSLFIFFFTLLNLVIQFLLIINKRSATIISGLTALTQIILIFFFHQNLFQIIQNSLIATLTGLIISLIFTRKLLYK